MAKVTLKVLADLLKISTATVSKALKDYSDINPETKQKVKDLAKKLQYTPNTFAQSLQSNESKIIGILVPDLVHHFFSSIIKSVLIEAEKNGYLVIVLQSNESYKKELKQLKNLTNKNIDGILISLSDKTIKYDHITKIINDGTPVVLFDKISRLVNCPKVIIDDRKAAFLATEHLLKTGCKKIAYITGPLKPQTTIDRYMGYRKALETYQIPFDKSLVYVREKISFKDGQKVTPLILKEHPDLDAIFAFVDPVAIGVLKALNKLKIAVPAQVSVIGFSNWFITKTTTPSLSTIDQPGAEIGKRAFELLLTNLQNKKKGNPLNNEIVEVPTRLINRKSTK